MRPRTMKAERNPDILERAIAAASVGASIEDAAFAGGVSRETLNNYIALGREAWNERADGEIPKGKRLAKRQEFFADFYARWVEAREKLKSRLLQRIEDAGEDPRNWRANVWILETMFPKQFGRGKQRGDYATAPPAPIASPTPPVVPHSTQAGPNVVKLFEGK